MIVFFMRAMVQSHDPRYVLGNDIAAIVTRIYIGVLVVLYRRMYVDLLIVALV